MKTFLHSYIKLLVITLLFFTSLIAHGQTGGLTVISNPSGGTSELKQSELKSILMGERQRWRNDKKIVIAMMKTTTNAGMDICARIYDMTPDELKKYWLGLVFQGKAEAPSFFNSASEVQAFVAETPGAIGVIDSPSAHSGTMIVLIDGKKSF
jgi:hypothetical protein